MIRLQKIKDEYDRKGYVIIPNLVSQEKILIFRKKILDFFTKHPTQRYMWPSDVINNFSEVFELQTNLELLSACKEIFNDFNYVNNFQIQKNMCNKDDIGWHYDGAGSFNIKDKRTIDHIHKELNNHFRFARIGICLTENDCPYGQMIDIVRGSHRWGNYTRALFNKLLVNKFVPKLIKNYLSDDMTGKINPGDCVIFDFGLLHRSQMAKIDDIPEYRNKASYVITNDSKLTIYFEVGNKDSCQWYLKNELALANKTERGSKEEKYRSDYLRFDKSLYPDSYVTELKNHDVAIAELSANERLITADIFSSH